MTSPPIAMHSLSEIKTIDSGSQAPYVLRLPEIKHGDMIQAPVETICIPVLTRKEGLMLCMPCSALPPEIVESDLAIEEDALIGPCLNVNIPCVMIEEDGTPKTLDMDISCILGDFHQAILPRLRLFDHAEGGEILSFLEGGQDVFPVASVVHQTALAWLEQQAEVGRIAYYSAVEEAPVQDAALPARASRARASPKEAVPKAGVPKARVTTASLSHQLNALTETIPVFSSQLQIVQERQDQLAELLLAKSAPPPLPHRQGFATPAVKRPQGVSPASFMSQVGPPPKVRAAAKAASSKPLALEEDEPFELPEENAPVALAGAGSQQIDIGMMLLKQQQALTSLVAHMASQDGLQDFGGASSSSSISLKGSARREKLLAELAQRRGNFFLKVAQNAFRRLKPSETLPPSLEDFQGKPIFTKYVEKQGGYSGHQRESGLIMWLLAHVADQLIAGDVVGAQEMLALSMVAIEQSSLDQGRWEVAWILALQEEPPPQIFASRSAQTNPRLRAFGPLCPAEWGATALAYVKELDLLNVRRQEAVPRKPGQPGKPDEEKGEDKKKQPRYPKKPKGGAQPPSTET
eukprot:Skav217634  [mRNA]  locus=scaffold1334:19891:21624:- [translate_table: standard]